MRSNENDWFEIKKIDPTTYAICEHGHWEKMNSYLLIGSEEALLIDTGLGIGNIKQMVDEITDLPIMVVSTHVHWDHIGGHSLFDRIYVHENEREWLENGIPIPLEIIRKQIEKEIFTITPPDSFNIEKYSVYQGKPSGLLNDNQLINIGGREISVMHTPGHSPGHLCFYDEKMHYLFSGDLIYHGLLFANYPSTDPVEFIKSVERVNSLEKINKVLPSHNAVDIPVAVISELLELLNRIEEKGDLRHGTGNFFSETVGIAL